MNKKIKASLFAMAAQSMLAVSTQAQEISLKHFDVTDVAFKSCLLAGISGQLPGTSSVPSILRVLSPEPENGIIFKHDEPTKSDRVVVYDTGDIFIVTRRADAHMLVPDSVFGLIKFLRLPGDLVGQLMTYTQEEDYTLRVEYQNDKRTPLQSGKGMPSLAETNDIVSSQYMIVDKIEDCEFESALRPPELRDDSILSMPQM